MCAHLITCYEVRVRMARRADTVPYHDCIVVTLYTVTSQVVIHEDQKDRFHHSIVMGDLFSCTPSANGNNLKHVFDASFRTTTVTGRHA